MTDKYILIENGKVTNVIVGESDGYIQATGHLADAEIGDIIKNGKIVAPPTPPRTAEMVQSEMLAKRQEWIERHAEVDLSGDKHTHDKECKRIKAEWQTLKAEYDQLKVST